MRSHVLQPHTSDEADVARSIHSRHCEVAAGSHGQEQRPHLLQADCFDSFWKASARKCRLLTASHPKYLGFSSLETPSQLGAFIAQDSIEWTQQLTREMGKLGGSNSKACLANLWSQFSDSGIFVKVNAAKD